MDASAAPEAMESFVKRVLAMQAAWVVAGADGLVRVPSPSKPGRVATLLWSKRSEAERRGSPMTEYPKVKPLTLPELYIDVLPKLTELGRLVGVETPSELICEIEPADLARQMRAEAFALFLRKVHGTGSLCILQGPDGPAFVMSKKIPGLQMLPCWHDRPSAQARIAGPLADTVVADVSLADFREKLLPRIAESARAVAPAYCEGDGVLEFTAIALKGLLDRPSQPVPEPVNRVA